MSFRVPLMNHQQTFGLSSKMIFLLWCVSGGFLLYFLECNYLTILLKPYYEQPIDTAQDVLNKDRGLTDILIFPGFERFKEMAINQNDSEVFRDIGKMTTVAKVSYIFVSKSNTYIKTWNFD